jgi:hypothetical protein
MRAVFRRKPTDAVDWRFAQRYQAARAAGCHIFCVSRLQRGRDVHELDCDALVSSLYDDEADLQNAMKAVATSKLTDIKDMRAELARCRQKTIRWHAR